MKEYSYWLDTLDRPSVAPSPAVSPQPPVLPSRVDVVVVGAGYTGLSAARQLAQAGAAVLVLDRDRIGGGASSRNAGQVLTGLKLDPATLVSRYGEHRARQLFDVAQQAIDDLERVIASESIDCDYHRTGHIQAASKRGHFAALRDEQALLSRVFDHRVELVSRHEQHTEVGSDFYHGLLVDDRSGAINPARFVDGLAAAAVRAGACLLTRVAVTGSRRSANRWVVSTTAGEVDAADCLLATDAYSDDAAPSLQRRFVPIGSYIIVTVPLTQEQASFVLPKGRMAFDSMNFLHYFRLTRDNRLLFGGRAEFSQPDVGTTRRAAAILQRGLRLVFPQLSDVAIDYAWGGNVGFTRDQLPHAGKLDDAYYAGGYCGHGVAMATYLGAQIARRICGESIDQPLFDDRFRAIPLYSGTPWFLPLVGAYYRVLDWIG